MYCLAMSRAASSDEKIFSLLSCRQRGHREEASEAVAPGAGAAP